MNLKLYIQSNEKLLQGFGRKPLIHSAIMAVGASVTDAVSKFNEIPTIHTLIHVLGAGFLVGFLYIGKNIFLGGSQPEENKPNTPQL